LGHETGNGMSIRELLDLIIPSNPASGKCSDWTYQSGRPSHVGLDARQGVATGYITPGTPVPSTQDKTFRGSRCICHGPRKISISYPRLSRGEFISRNYVVLGLYLCQAQWTTGIVTLVYRANLLSSPQPHSSGKKMQVSPYLHFQP
jgi:hypothetical protein